MYRNFGYQLIFLDLIDVYGLAVGARPSVYTPSIDFESAVVGEC